MRSRFAEPGLGAAAAAGLVLLALGLLVLLPAGCKTGATGVGAAEAYTVPDWDDLNISTLAYVGMGSSVGDQQARSMAEQIVDEHLRAGQTRYVVLGPTQARSRAAAKDAGDTFDKVLRVWRDSRTADLFLVKNLCEAIGVDGLVLADLGDWKESTVDLDAEGSSFTRVQIRLAIYSGRTGQLAWEASKTHRKESLHYQPGQVGSSRYVDGTGAERSERTTSLSTPKPPRAEDVAAELMQSLLAALPPKPGD